MIYSQSRLSIKTIKQKKIDFITKKDHKNKVLDNHNNQINLIYGIEKLFDNIFFWANLRYKNNQRLIFVLSILFIFWIFFSNYQFRFLKDCFKLFSRRVNSQ